jgi:hypothetical protein
MRIDMALQTHKPGFAAQRQHPIHRSVRRMARRATFNFHGSVFEYPWSAFVHVAIDAGFPVGFLQHRLISRAMRVMAVRAFDQAFIHSMVRWKVELRLHNSVTAIADLRL